MSKELVECTTEELQELSDDALKHLWQKEAIRLSYFNAAEGDEWKREEVPRCACKGYFWRIHAETATRGLTMDVRGYLL